MPNLPEATREWDPLYTTIDGMYEYRKSGLLCLPCMTEKIMDELMEDFKFKPDDVLIASYPQSGFLWIQEVIWHLHNMDTLNTPIKDKEALAIRLPFLEHEFRNVDPMALLKDMESPRIMKTHLEYKHLEKQMAGNEDEVKIILWALDPRSMLLNYHRFWSVCGVEFGFPKVTWEKFFDLFKDKQLFEGDWYDMNCSWLEKFGDKDNLLVLHYEDAAKDLEGTVRKVAEFLNIDLKGKGFKVQKLAHMKPFDKDPEWQKHMSEEQVDYMKNLYAEKMKDSQFENTYAQ